MHYYFLLKPQGLNGSITLANFDPLGKGPIHKELIIHAFYSDGSKWICRDLATIKHNSSLTIHDKEFPNDFANKSVFLFMHPKKQNSVLEQLIVHDNMEWRANIKIYSDFTAASYQGEFSSRMTQANKPSIVSCSPMIQRGENMISEIILVNLSFLPQKSKRKVLIVNDKKEIIKEVNVYTNEHNYIDLNDVVSSYPDDMFVTLSDEFIGIPLYFSKTLDNRNMSIEHTHPPVSYVVFGDQHYFQRRKKSWWFDGLTYKS